MLNEQEKKKFFQRLSKEVTPSFVLENVQFQLTNFRKSLDELLDKPYFRTADLAASYYVNLEGLGYGYGRLSVSESLLVFLGISEEKLREAAIRNTWESSRFIILGKNDFPQETSVPLSFPDDTETVLSQLKAGNLETPAVLTNESLHFGAGVLLCPQWQEICRQDLYILPSSVHETILVPAKDADVRELQRTVETINRTQVRPSEVLSDNVYLYDWHIQRLSLCCDSFGLVPLSQETEVSAGRDSAHRSHARGR